MCRQLLFLLSGKQFSNSLENVGNKLMDPYAVTIIKAFPVVFLYCIFVLIFL